jgi:hypothetical protein
MEKKDACYYKIKSSAKVWPSAYASGRLVQCRKKGAANYGNKSESVAEGLNEFDMSGSDGGDDGFSEETLKRLAAQWWNGDEDPRVEKLLMSAGWEIGQDEGYDDEPGVFVVQTGDDRGDSYISWPAHELKQGVAEGENAILSPGTEVTVPHKGKMVPGKIVRYDSGKGIDSPAYIVDISEYESLIVPVSRVKQDMDEGENWSKHNNPRAGGMSKKSVSSYRRSHPGSKIQTAVTTKPSKLKKGSKAAARRKSFCARMRGMKKHRTGAKTAHDPNSNINKSLRRWHCESIEELHELVMLAEQFIRNNKK